MANLFNREFKNIDEHTLQDLHTLEKEGALYNYLFYDKYNEFVYTRVQLTPKEIIEFIDGTFAYDEFLGLLNRLDDPELALSKLSNKKIMLQVLNYNEWTSSVDQEDMKFCYAAFIGENLEELLCTIKEDRHEILAKNYTGDRRFLLQEILEMFPHAVSLLKDRDAGRSPYLIENEQDVRDLIFAIIKCCFPDAKMEEYTPIHVGRSKRIDIVVPKISTVIEVKIIRGKNHSKNVGDELKIDIESYHSHKNCSTLIVFIWDAENFLTDRHNFIKELRGLRVKNEHQFNVEVIIKP